MQLIDEIKELKETLAAEQRVRPCGECLSVFGLVRMIALFCCVCICGHFYLFV